MAYIDLFTVIISAVIYVIIGFLWYSPYLFGKLWRRLKGYSVKVRWYRVLGEFINGFIISYFLAFFEWYLKCTSFWDGVIAGAIVWLGFVATSQFSALLWSKKKSNLFLLENSCWVLSFMVMGGVLAG